MFQFPRKFPHFIPSSPSSSSADPASTSDAATSIKPDPDAPSSSGAAGGGGRKVAPPPWGRFGSRQEKAARWSAHEGRIGTLCVHRSGKVTLKLEGDLRYEVRRGPACCFEWETGCCVSPALLVERLGNVTHS